MRTKRPEDIKKIKEYCEYINRNSVNETKSIEELFTDYRCSSGKEREILRGKLIQMNLPFIIKFIVKKYNYNYDINPVFDLDDIIQEGNLLLIKAIDTYDYTKGKFLTYLYKIMQYELYYANGLANSPVNFGRVCTKEYKKIKKMVDLDYSDEEIISTYGISHKLLKSLKPFLLGRESYETWKEKVEYLENIESNMINEMGVEDCNILKLLEEDNIRKRNQAINRAIKTLSQLAQELIINKFDMSDKEPMKLCHVVHNRNCSLSNIYKICDKALKDLGKCEELSEVYGLVDTDYDDYNEGKAYYLQK